MILIAPDKFKGTFSASEMCALIANRLRQSGFNDELQLVPLSDGGEGIAEVLMPDGIMVSPGVYEHNGTRLIVSSEIIGFDAFKDSNIPLMQRSSLALGKAVNPDYPTYIAIGGTATSDCGAGFLQGLGAKFYTPSHRLISEPLTPASLHTVAYADLASLNTYNIKGIIDVRASLCDGTLTALDFAPQKALPGEDISGLRSALKHFQSVVGGTSEWDGAGGGLGYAIASVIGAPCMSGAEMTIKNLDLSNHDVRLVITGEGCVDSQTVSGGKLVDTLYRKATAQGIPTLIIYGRAIPPLPYPHTAQLNSNWESLAAALALVAKA